MEKNEDIRKILDSVTKDLGIELVDLGGKKNLQFDAPSTGSISLDEALGAGGIPKGRIVELYGPESGGKSSISLMVAAEVQKRGGLPFLIDAENSFGPEWATKLGVDIDPDKFPIVQENCAETIFDLLEKLTVSNKFDLIIVDSVTALSPKQELEGGMTDQTIGLQARIISKGLRKLVGKVGKSKTIVIFINQLREKVGVMFGNPETTPGGRALKFYSSIRMRVSRDGPELKNEAKDSIGHNIKVKIEKNKIGAPYKEAMLTLLYDKGLDHVEEIFDMALKRGVIVVQGHTYTFQGQSWRGKEATKSAIRINGEMQAKLSKLIRETKTAVPQLPELATEEESSEKKEF